MLRTRILDASKPRSSKHYANPALQGLRIPILDISGPNSSIHSAACFGALKIPSLDTSEPKPFLLCATFNFEDICDVTRFRQTQTHKGDSRRRAQSNVDTSIVHSVLYPTNVHECRSHGPIQLINVMPQISKSTTAARASERYRMIRHSVAQASVAEGGPIRPDLAPPASLASDNGLSDFGIRYVLAV